VVREASSSKKVTSSKKFLSFIVFFSLSFPFHILEQIVAEHEGKPPNGDYFSIEALIQASPSLIGGSRAALRSLFEVVNFPLRFPHLFAQLNVECPKGVLLYGPPGVGKTMLVSTIASFCGAKMVIIIK
jgi:ATP-dependent Zn protease